MPTAIIYNFPTSPSHIPAIDYTGIITSHIPGVSGLVEIRSPPELRGHVIPYDKTNLMTPGLLRYCEQSKAVEGLARWDFPTPGWNIFTLTPFGGVGEILAPTPQPNLWQRFRKLIRFSP